MFLAKCLHKQISITINGITKTIDLFALYVLYATEGYLFRELSLIKGF